MLPSLPAKPHYWTKFVICCAWIALAIVPPFINLDQVTMPIRLHGALLILTGLLEASFPVAIVYLLILWRRAT